MILLINSCLNDFYLGLYDGNKIIAKTVIPCYQKLSEKMIIEIDKFLKKTNLEITDIKKIYITNGPGSFTGIRLGILFAKTLNIIYKMPILTIDTLSTLIKNENGIITLDARSGKFYTGQFSDGKLVNNVTVEVKDYKTTKLNYAIINNMVDKINQAIEHLNYKTVVVKYIKDIVK